MRATSGRCLCRSTCGGASGCGDVSGRPRGLRSGCVKACHGRRMPRASKSRRGRFCACQASSASMGRRSVRDPPGAGHRRVAGPTAALAGRRGQHPPAPCCTRASCAPAAAGCPSARWPPPSTPAHSCHQSLAAGAAVGRALEMAKAVRPSIKRARRVGRIRNARQPLAPGAPAGRQAPPAHGPPWLTREDVGAVAAEAHRKHALHALGVVHVARVAAIEREDAHCGGRRGSAAVGAMAACALLWGSAWPAGPHIASGPHPGRHHAPDRS